MAIPESQLQTWSAQGSVQQSAATYQTLKNTLEDVNAPYSHRSFYTFLQGSYGNDTNIWSDSDVDIVICTTSVFYYDIDNLADYEQRNFHTAFPGSASYSYQDFKKEVTGWLILQYGHAVRPGKKAIFVQGNDSRRDADVLPAAEYRQYYEHRNIASTGYWRGIVFWKTDGTRIVNFPKQHSDNCTTKHQGTNNWFKPTVRVFKNIRNKMIQLGILEDGIAPSYYIEGLLYNVPNQIFGQSFQRTVLSCLSYASNADRSTFKCANGIHPLLRDNSEVSWSPDHCSRFLTALQFYWDHHQG
jgi:hypothetical protein